MKRLALLFFLVPTLSFGQSGFKDGFYLPIDQEDCGGDTMEFAEERFCLPELPLFNLGVIESLGPLKKEGKASRFDLRLKKEEAEELRKVTRKLNRFKIIILLDQEVVGLIEFRVLSDYSLLHFDSSKLRGQIEEIHAYLREALNALNGKGEG